MTCVVCRVVWCQQLTTPPLRIMEKKPIAPASSIPCIYPLNSKVSTKVGL